jgi:hypothetical protein
VLVIIHYNVDIYTYNQAYCIYGSYSLWQLHSSLVCLKLKNCYEIYILRIQFVLRIFVYVLKHFLKLRK